MEWEGTLPVGAGGSVSTGRAACWGRRLQWPNQPKRSGGKRSGGKRSGGREVAGEMGGMVRRSSCLPAHAVEAHG